MSDIRQPWLLWLKAGLFLLLGVLSSALLLAYSPEITTLLLHGVAVWAFCRAYYFAFYVVEKYADPGYRFAGLLDFAQYALGRRRQRERECSADKGAREVP
ncbi:hypothetical protein DB346_19775 [Verrucomicrobia bacterium LW23]|nr:hypothetical protein DB346_19775 [Verrucomicrobia bacterium LW23]